MNSRDRKKLARYRWLLRHPIIMDILFAVSILLYFTLTVFVETEYKAALEIFAVLPLVISIAVYFFLEMQGKRTLQRFSEQDISVSAILQIYEHLYAGIDFTKRRNADTYRDYVTAVAPLYTLLGEFERAVRMYRDFLSVSKSNKTAQKVYRAVLLSDLADCFAEKGDFDNARRAMHESDMLLQSSFKFSRKKQRAAENELNALARAKIELKNGNPAPMAAILADIPPDNSRMPAVCLSVTRLQGLTAYMQGDYREAQRAYDYVYLHGKGTFYEQEAKYYLDKLREQDAY